MYHSLAEAYQSVGNYPESERWFKAAVDQVQESNSRQQQQANTRQQYNKRTMKTASSGSDGLQTSRSDQVAAHLTYARFLAKNVSGIRFVACLIFFPSPLHRNPLPSG